MNSSHATAKFALGKVVGTPGALRALAANGQTPAEFLDRHVRGDWGQVAEDGARLNDEAIFHGGRILSIYAMASGEPLWIITAANRLSTCVLLPDEY